MESERGLRLILLRLGLLLTSQMMLLLAQPFLSRDRGCDPDELDSPFECPATPSTPPTGTDAMP